MRPFRGTRATVVRTNSSEPEFEATTSLVPVLIAIIIASKSALAESVIVSPFIVIGALLEPILGSATVPVTVKSVTVFVVPSITTVFPVVNVEFLVAVVVCDILSVELYSTVNDVPSIVIWSP